MGGFFFIEPDGERKLLHINIPDILFIAVHELPVPSAGFKQCFNMTRLTRTKGNEVAEVFMFPEPVTMQGMIPQVGNDNIFFFRGGEEIGGGKQPV